ncbi:DUF1801 domain-containing protein [Mucilaginibacter terrenus]|uniref:DUF1801 domain-containing protein n=1 Tax=Mucilaginibacter terrenus TaxID=2482727 RepID=A0A3E2NTT2_9SPHI|nr:DUF1801 domain-containing protein [Mucilaginibacter terrenus]RFZ84418.1 DUF1801 domain-containing protein [Mucilaginibacter terrenus]
MTAKKIKEKFADTAEVDIYMQKLDHPLKDVLQALRQVILESSNEIGEHIKWNSPSFLFTGEMSPFDPKEYKRYIIVSNMLQKECVRLVFLSGAKLNDPGQLLTGNYTDGRRIAMFHNLAEVSAKKQQLQQLIAQWLEVLER